MTGLFENKTLNLKADTPVRISEVKEYFTQRKVSPTGRSDGRDKLVGVCRCDRAETMQ